jgi:hypothetical protein
VATAGFKEGPYTTGELLVSTSAESVGPLLALVACLRALRGVAVVSSVAAAVAFWDSVAFLRLRNTGYKWGSVGTATLVANNEDEADGAAAAAPPKMDSTNDDGDMVEADGIVTM